MSHICRLVSISEETAHSLKEDIDTVSLDWRERTRRITTGARGVSMNLDRSFDGIHFILTGSYSADNGSPLSRVVFGGLVVDAANPRFTLLMPSEVTEVARALRDIGRRKFLARCKELEDLARKFGLDLDVNEEYYLAHFMRMSNFYEDASRRRFGVLRKIG